MKFVPASGPGGAPLTPSGCAPQGPLVKQIPPPNPGPSGATGKGRRERGGDRKRGREPISLGYEKANGGARVPFSRPLRARARRKLTRREILGAWPAGGPQHPQQHRPGAEVLRLPEAIRVGRSPSPQRDLGSP